MTEHDDNMTAWIEEVRRRMAAGEPPPPRPDAEERMRQIAEEQGTTGKSTYENLLGAGADLWDSDEELDQFLADLRERKRQDVLREIDRDRPRGADEW